MEDKRKHKRYEENLEKYNQTKDYDLEDIKYEDIK